MYLAFNSAVHIHETIPPDNTTTVWIQSSPKNKFTPTTSLLVNSAVSPIPESKQLTYIYEFESTPKVRVYSNVSGSWELTTKGYTLVSSDGCILTDSTGKLLTTE